MRFSSHKYEPLPKSEDTAPTTLGHQSSQRRRLTTLVLLALVFAALLLCYTTIVAFSVLTAEHAHIRNKEAKARENESSHNAALVRAGYRVDIPMWAQKSVALAKYHPPTDKKICYVHVGKTAGTTLACYLGFLYSECDSVTEGNVTFPAIPMSAGLLPASTTNLIHTEYDDCATNNDFDYYLFVLRDPLKRMQSWFTYELPDNNQGSRERREKQKQLFTDCAFHTLNELGERGLAPRRSSSSSNTTTTSTTTATTANTTNASEALCQVRARTAIAGTVGYSTHNFYNFRYYLQQVQIAHDNDKVNILAIRTEHIDADWKSIEEDVLHGMRNHPIAFAKKPRNASKKRPQDLVLSDTARERICHALCDEILVYKELLHRAVNLRPDDVAESLEELKESCPVEAAKVSCDSFAL